MGSKQISEEELPPPYSLRASDPASASASTSHSARDSLTSHLQNHLASLPSRIRMTQEAHSIRQSLDDASLLDILLPEIDDFLAYIGSLHPTPKLSHLTLIPGAAVPPNAILSGMEEMRRRGEPCRVARVDVNPGKEEKKSATSGGANQDTASNDQDWSAGREFSDWGRFGDSALGDGTDPSQARNLVWWRDEDMARRLARHLQPAAAKTEPPAPQLETPVQEIVEHRLPAQKQQKKGWFWSKKSSSSGSASTFATKTVQTEVEGLRGSDGTAQPVAKEAREKEDDGARMSVTAEEVAFRSENDFGIMESTRGWAIVIMVHVKT